MQRNLIVIKVKVCNTLNFILYPDDDKNIVQQPVKNKKGKKCAKTPDSKIYFLIRSIKQFTTSNLDDFNDGDILGALEEIDSANKISPFSPSLPPAGDLMLWHFLFKN